MGIIYKNDISYGGGSSGGSGSSDYSDLSNKPQINGTTLAQGQVTSDLGIADEDTIYINDNEKLAIGIISSTQINALFA